MRIYRRDTTSFGSRDTPGRLAEARAILDDRLQHWPRPGGAGRAQSLGVQGDIEAGVVTADGPVLGFGVHEWFTACGEHEAANHAWLPPLAVLIGLMWNAIAATRLPTPRVLWIGRRVWPHPHALVLRNPTDPTDAGDRRLLERSAFVDPSSNAERVWAIEQASRCSGVAAVVADGRGLKRPESRRLQLAAGAGRSVVLLARPGRERRALSAAWSRWVVAPCARDEHPQPAHHSIHQPAHPQQWRVELARHKGAPSESGTARRWLVRRDHATGAIRAWQACDGDLAADVADRPHPAARASVA